MPMPTPTKPEHIRIGSNNLKKSRIPSTLDIKIHRLEADPGRKPVIITPPDPSTTDPLAGLDLDTLL